MSRLGGKDSLSELRRVPRSPTVAGSPPAPAVLELIRHGRRKSTAGQGRVVGARVRFTTGRSYSAAHQQGAAWPSRPVKRLSLSAREPNSDLLRRRGREEQLIAMQNTANPI